MLIRTQVPSMPLAMFVDYFWYMEGYSPAHSREMALPDGSADIIIELGAESIRLFARGGRALAFGHSVLCGPHSDYFIIDTSGESRVIGVHFKPGGLHPFVLEPLAEAFNSLLPLHAVWGERSGELRDRLLEALLPDDMFRVLEHCLLSLAQKRLEWHPAVRYVLDRLQHDEGSISGLVEQIGLSHRRFNEIFKADVGMTPKRLHRLCRFQEALQLARGGGSVPWAEVALRCGYYDQAHFIKDFQSFAGIAPREYRPISGRHHNHAPLTK